MKKSCVLVPVPAAVDTATFPERAEIGTVVLMVLAVAESTTASVRLNRTSLLSGVVSKLVPVIDTAVPVVPTVGVKLAIVGAPVGAPVTVKLVPLMAEPAGDVTALASRGQVLQSDTLLPALYLFEPSAHRRVMDSQINRDLVQPIPVLSVRLRYPCLPTPVKNPLQRRFAGQVMQ